MLTIADVCQRLGCSQTTAYRLVHMGWLKAHKNPGRNSSLRITEEAFNDYLRANVVGANAEEREPA